MYVDQDPEVRQESETVTIIKDFLKFLLYSAIIHFINYSLQLPTVFSIVPPVILLLLIILFTRYWKNKKRQYAILVPYVAVYFGFCLYFYNRGELMPLTASCMTAILAVWGVVCIECIGKGAKRTLIGVLILAMVAGGAYAGIWAYYSGKAKAVTQKVASAPEISGTLAGEVDALSKELNTVFYAKEKINNQFYEIMSKLGTETDSAKRNELNSVYQQFLENLKNADGKWIHTIVTGEESIKKSMDKIYLND